MLDLRGTHTCILRANSDKTVNTDLAVFVRLGYRPSLRGNVETAGVSVAYTGEQLLGDINHWI